MFSFDGGVNAIWDMMVLFQVVVVYIKSKNKQHMTHHQVIVRV